MSEMTHSWWENISKKNLSDTEKIARLQQFFADNGEALYGRALIEKVITLEQQSFTIPESYPTNIAALNIVPMWAGKTIGWRIV